ncbi:nitrogen specific signal transduction histidine kinase NtrB [Tibeticola sediminis]|uniref:Sensory histidine kinase/phosphatase NtrB n=1 Tax=Tibeticola sediminis TaxID=1917811 RepID=A0A3N4V761_9BURK|nr:nitrogen regulation protein NR(II) [Tibeticola sediminis]RPE72927.1 nitrogen specific signal transduction histidine kinase NtrB [Tibeticola sediminis]
MKRQRGESAARIAFGAFDSLATLVAVLDADHRVVFANAALEDALGLPRRLVEGTLLVDWFQDGASLVHALDGLERNAYAALRYEAQLRRTQREPLPVHVIVTRAEAPHRAVVELVPLEAQVRKEREERLVDQAAANKELVRNLAHEIKNPLGGIRGAAQLLDLELSTPALRDYTQVIVHEADRLQGLVDRLLAPHRSPQVVGDVNIHEVCERVRTLVLAEYPAGLSIQRDYDTSIPEFRGDREQLIQAVLNVVQNAAQALAERRARGDALIVLRTRVARQVTLGSHRHRLALELHVIDNGPGIPHSIKDRVFLPLVSAREGGSGLGLTLAQTFVQQHQGLIECESAPGRTVFKIVIPLP